MVEVRPGVYHDSVTLMRVSRALTEQPGVTVAIVAMATELNLGLARDLGFDGAARDARRPARGGARPASPAELEDAAAELERQLARTGAGERHAAASAPPRTTRSAARRRRGEPGAGVVPGEHAFAEALDAVEAGSRDDLQ